MMCAEKAAGPLYPLRSGVYLVARPGLLRYAGWRHRRGMASLHEHAVIACRTRLLERMAGLAGRISGLEHHEPDTGTWMVTAGLLRAVAASERGQTLAGLNIASDPDLWPAAPGEGVPAGGVQVVPAMARPRRGEAPVVAGRPGPG